MGSLIGRISPMSGFPDFASLADTLSSLSAKIDGKTAVFYSGRDSDGVVNRGNAGECVSNNSNNYYVKCVRG